MAQKAIVAKTTRKRARRAPSTSPSSGKRSGRTQRRKARNDKTRTARVAKIKTAHLTEYARSVLTAEANAILSVRKKLNRSFIDALALIQNCLGSVVVTGMGKPGFIAQKLSATLASTGIRSIYLHPADALHGDLGRVREGDVVLVLSNSGATEELVRLVPALRRMGAQIVAVTGERRSQLAANADVVVDIGRIDEACPMGLVPTASSAALLAVCDAMAMTLVKQRQFSTEEYARLHPGGKLGKSVMRVSELMRSGASNPIVKGSASLSDTVAVMTQTPGRPGAANVIDRSGKLIGIFTDGDLRRCVERGKVDFSVPVKTLIAGNPRVAQADALVLDAAAVMREAKVDQLPVVDDQGKPVGILDVQDLLMAKLL